MTVSGAISATNLTFATPYAGSYTLGGSSGTLSITGSASTIVQNGRGAPMGINVPVVFSTSASLSGAGAGLVMLSGAVSGGSSGFGDQQRQLGLLQHEHLYRPTTLSGGTLDLQTSTPPKTAP